VSDRLPVSAGESVCLGIKRPVLKHDLLYDPLFYSYLLVSNFFLRLSWTYKLSPSLSRNQLVVLVFAVLEVFRWASGIAFWGL
jgi:EXS family